MITPGIVEIEEIEDSLDWAKHALQVQDQSAFEDLMSSIYDQLEELEKRVESHFPPSL
jgi:hypothetical protein